MAEKKKQLSVHANIPSGKDALVGIVVSEWNPEITGRLLSGCRDTLHQAGVSEENIQLLEVPGSFELPTGARFLQSSKKLDAIICLGCLIKGETRHDEYIAQAVASGLMQLSILSATPVIFGLLTTENFDQAMERAGGKHGNKGTEAAVTALKMIALRKGLKGGASKIGFSF